MTEHKTDREQTKPYWFSLSLSSKSGILFPFSISPATFMVAPKWKEGRKRRASVLCQRILEHLETVF